jgi:hypothetical protein
MDWALAYRPCDLPGGRGRSVGQPVLRSQFAEFGQLVARSPAPDISPFCAGRGEREPRAGSGSGSGRAATARKARAASAFNPPGI